MANVIFHKVVSTLPSTLVANSVYFVKDGSAVRIHVTNNTGTIVATEVAPNEFQPASMSAIAGDFVYFGGTTSSADNSWFVNRVSKTDSSRLKATIANNSTYTTLATAFQNRGSLTYA